MKQGHCALYWRIGKRIGLSLPDQLKLIGLDVYKTLIPTVFWGTLNLTLSDWDQLDITLVGV